MSQSLTSPGRMRRRAWGFTLIELLVVVAIIVVLLSMLIVAVNAATRASQKANTIALMDSIGKALVRFKGDIGYYPPVLGVSMAAAPNAPGTFTSPSDLRRLYPYSVPVPGSANYAEHMQEYYSTCTLADYLIGYDVGENDGYGYLPDEIPSLGIRHPGDDGVWRATFSGAADGTLEARDPPTAAEGGKVFGPYLELKDERLLAGVYYPLGGGPVATYFPGDAIPDGLTFDELPKAIVDYWGMPIRYYRRPYPPGALGQSYRPGLDINGDGEIDEDDHLPTLSHVYVLRPYQFSRGTDIDVPDDFKDAGGDTGTTFELNTAEFALLSSGPDKRLNNDYRVDEEEFNADNIVKVGP